jgi:hypothetical protein
MAHKRHSRRRSRRGGFDTSTVTQGVTNGVSAVGSTVASGASAVGSTLASGVDATGQKLKEMATATSTSSWNPLNWFRGGKSRRRHRKHSSRRRKYRGGMEPYLDSGSYPNAADVNFAPTAAAHDYVGGKRRSKRRGGARKRTKRIFI